MSHTDKFDEAIRTVTDERGEVYGHPADDFHLVNALKAEVQLCPDPEIRHALEMICVKMARLVKTPDHLDSAIDIAGYARTICMIVDRKGGYSGKDLVLDKEEFLKAVGAHPDVDITRDDPLGAEYRYPTE